MLLAQCQMVCQYEFQQVTEELKLHFCDKDYHMTKECYVDLDDSTIITPFQLNPVGPDAQFTDDSDREALYTMCEKAAMELFYHPRYVDGDDDKFISAVDALVQYFVNQGVSN